MPMNTATRTAAHRLIDALDDAELALRDYQAPELAYRPASDDTETDTIICPWCDGELPAHDGVIEVDADRRENDGALEINDDHIDIVISRGPRPTRRSTTPRAAASCR